MKTADTAHTGIFASVIMPFPNFWTELGDEAIMVVPYHYSIAIASY